MSSSTIKRLQRFQRPAIFKMNVKPISFDYFTRIPVKIGNLAGMVLYYTDALKPKSAYRWKNVFFWISYFVLSEVVFFELMFLVKSFGNYKNFLEMTALAPCMGFCLLGLYKMLVIWNNRVKITEIINSLKEIYPKTIEEQEKWNVKLYKDETNTIMYWFVALNFISIIFFNFMAFFVSMFDLFQTGVYRKEFPYFLWYPYDVYTDDFMIFEINYAIQAWAGFLAIIGILSTDLLFCSIVTQLCMQFDILGGQLKEFVPEKTEKDLKFLGECVHRHNVLYRLVLCIYDRWRLFFFCFMENLV